MLKLVDIISWNTYLRNHLFGFTKAKIQKRKYKSLQSTGIWCTAYCQGGRADDARHESHLQAPHVLDTIYNLRFIIAESH